MDRIDYRLADMVNAAVTGSESRVHNAEAAIKDAEQALWALPLHFESSAQAREAIEAANDLARNNRSPVFDDEHCSNMYVNTIQEWRDILDNNVKPLPVRFNLQAAAVQFAYHAATICALRQSHPHAMDPDALEAVITDAECSLARVASLTNEMKAVQAAPRLEEEAPALSVPGF